jgi:eukaryotic-like serine/threonine-protein kinase
MNPSWNLEEGAPIAEGRTVLESLGGGRRYEVFLVWDEDLQLSAVAKILRPNRVEDEIAVNALRREADLLERLVHPVLVRGLGAVLDGPLPHLLVQYVDGDNLREIVEKEATLSVREAIPVALELLAALDYMAANGVCHLDVKPSNILLADPARLIDLGAARTLEELAARRTPIGTASYMAPEQCDPNAELGPIGPPADVWGVGTTLYHALTGNKPFSRPGPRGSNPTVRYPQLIERPLPFPDYVPGTMGTVIMEMLTHDPRDRPTATEASAALAPLLAEFA